MTNKLQSNHPDNCDELRDPEDRPVKNEQELREKMMDKTLADSFPTSDPLSSIPDPVGEDSVGSNENDIQNRGFHEVRDAKAGGAGPDRSNIDVRDDKEVRHWIESLGVSREQLEQLVRRHGDSAEKIREKLKKEAA